MRPATRLFHAARQTFLILVLLGLSGGMPSASPGDEGARQRFVQAERALKQKKLKTYRRLKKGLADYPLLPYLEYAELRSKLGSLTPARLDRFEKRYADTPLPAMLRRQWLNHKAKRQQWYDFLKGYRKDSSISRRCHYLNALIHTGRRAIAYERIPALWLSGSMRPKACIPVFDDWMEHRKLTRELLRQRVELAMRAGNTRLVSYLVKRMRGKDRRIAQSWLKLMKRPQQLLQAKQRLPAHPLRASAHAAVLKRLIRKDAASVLKQWPALAGQLGLSDRDRQRLGWRLGFRLLDDDHPQAMDFLDGIEPQDDDLASQERRLRAAIKRQDWARVLRWAAALPASARQGERWRYWRARASEAVGLRAEAQRLYRLVARERSYYGFLAADRIGGDYNLNDIPLRLNEKKLTALASRPAIARLRELYALGRATEARREWRELTRDMDKQELQILAKIAQRNGWLDRAIFTLARTGYWDDLELRFPLRHRDTIRDQALKHALDDAWVFAIVRQESAFMHDAHSSAGATGLMQLMPATARLIARELAHKKPRRADLLKPKTNITLGTGYLNKVKKQLGDSIVLATAAYNAGPHRVKRWLPEQATEADIWVESIPFRETRGYVRRVMSYLILYEKRLGRDTSSISKRMGVILPRPGTHTAKVADRG